MNKICPSGISVLMNFRIESPIAKLAMASSIYKLPSILSLKLLLLNFIEVPEKRITYLEGLKVPYASNECNDMIENMAFLFC